MFGNLYLTMGTLFEAVTGGFDWKEMTDELSKVGWSDVLVARVFVVFTVFAVMNITTGIFIEQLARSAFNEREVVIKSASRDRANVLRKLRDIFEKAKSPGPDTISREDFENCLRDKDTRALLSALGLDVHSASQLFSVLDTNGNENIDKKEFMSGFMHLRG